jgi:hypothetical protein
VIYPQYFKQDIASHTYVPIRFDFGQSYPAISRFNCEIYVRLLNSPQIPKVIHAQNIWPRFKKRQHYFLCLLANLHVLAVVTALF